MATPVWSREIEEELAPEHPQLWEKCYPKIYTGVDGKFHSPKIPSCFMLLSALKAALPETKLYSDFT